MSAVHVSRTVANTRVGLERDLNAKQSDLLDRIAEADPLARVVGWVADVKIGRGPIVAKSDGSTVLANFTGRSKALA